MNRPGRRGFEPFSDRRGVIFGQRGNIGATVVHPHLTQHGCNLAAVMGAVVKQLINIDPGLVGELPLVSAAVKAEVRL